MSTLQIIVIFKIKQTEKEDVAMIIEVIKWRHEFFLLH